MIDAKTVLALIMARGGSKGLPRKNLREVGGRPMLAWTIDAARKSRFIDRTVLSSEDPEIIAAARDLDCEVPFVRPIELARDETPAMDVVRHAVGCLDRTYDYLVLLQPTSPLRICEDIDGCLALCHGKGAPAAVSVTEADKSPHWMYRVGSDHRMSPLIPVERRPLRRQELPAYHVLNGAVFVARCDWLARRDDFVSSDTLAFIMPGARSVDIDDELQLRLANTLLGA